MTESRAAVLYDSASNEKGVLANPVRVANADLTTAKTQNVLGYNTAVGTTLSDIYEGAGAVIPLPTSAIQMSLVSTSAQDTVTGTGVQKVNVHGLNAAWEEIEEVVDLAGSTPVVTVNSYLRINDMHSQQVGSTGVAQGTITLKDDATKLIEYDRISSGGNRALQCHYTIPNGYVGYVRGWTCGSSGQNPVRFLLRATVDACERELVPGIYQFQAIAVLEQQTTYMLFDPSLRMPAHADIKVSALALIGGTSQASAQVNLLLEAVS